MLDAGREAGGDLTGSEIEILDLNSFYDKPEQEIVETEPSGSLSTIAVLAGLVVGGIALFGVVTTGNTPAPEPPAPSVTVPLPPVDPEEATLAAEVAELEATYGVEIGDGPDLRWSRVIWKIDTGEFTWVDDGFVGHDGITEWTIRPNLVGPSVLEQDSLELAYPDYELQHIEGARLLIPTQGGADHMLVIAGDRDPVRFDLPALENPPTTDLVRLVRFAWDGVVVGDHAIIASYRYPQVDLEVLGDRVGRDLSGFDFVAIGENGLRLRIVDNPGDEADLINFVEAGFTTAEIAELQRINNEPGQPETLALNLVSGGTELVPIAELQWAQAVAEVSNGAAVAWIDLDDQNWLSTSSDAIAWSTRPLSVDDGTVWFSGSRMYTLPANGRSIRRSNDLGGTWERTRRPFASSSVSLAVNDVLIVSGEQPESFSDQPVSVDTGDYVVTITGAGRSFELTNPETGELVLSGTLDDSATGVAFDPFGSGLAIADPESGEELLSIPQGALLQAYANASNLDVPDIAFARWDPDADDPEWHIQPIDALFNDAVRVDFKVGNGHVLAVVTTTRGYDYYVASTE